MPRAVFLSIALMAVGYDLFSYAAVTGFGYSAAKVGTSAIPFITVAHGVLAAFAFFAFLAGMTSTLGVLISAVNSQCRLIFNAGREGLLPSWLGKVHPTRRTPVNAIFTFVGIAGAIIAVWALLHVIGGHSGSMYPINFFVESSTLGTILLLVVYFLSNLALPFYYRKFPPEQFNAVKHLILPVLGMVAIAVPVYYLSRPGQSAPYNWFPYAALAMVIISVVYAFVLNGRDPSLGDRVGDHRRRTGRPGCPGAPGAFPFRIWEISHDRRSDPPGRDARLAPGAPAGSGHGRGVQGWPRDHGRRRPADGVDQVRLLRA